jgi:quinol monooxygenase YgiN
MNKSTVYFTVDLNIHEGKFDELAGIAQAMITSTQKEPGALGYDFYLSADRRRCRLLEAYTDANAVLTHLNGPTVRELVPSRSMAVPARRQRGPSQHLELRSLGSGVA